MGHKKYNNLVQLVPTSLFNQVFELSLRLNASRWAIWDSFRILFEVVNAIFVLLDSSNSISIKDYFFL